MEVLHLTEQCVMVFAKLRSLLSTTLIQDHRVNNKVTKCGDQLKSLEGTFHTYHFQYLCVKDQVGESLCSIQIKLREMGSFLEFDSIWEIHNW